METLLLRAALSNYDTIKYIRLQRNKWRPILASLISKILDFRSDIDAKVLAYALWMLVSHSVYGYQVTMTLVELEKSLWLNRSLDRIDRAVIEWSTIHAVANHVRRLHRKRQRDEDTLVSS